MIQEIISDDDLIGMLPDRMLTSRHATLLAPAHRHAKSLGLVSTATENGEYGIEAEEGVPGQGQGGHLLRVAVSIREEGSHRCLQIFGHHRGRIGHGSTVDRSARQRVKKTLARRHLCH